MTAGDARGPRITPAVERAFRILQLLQGGAPLSIAEMAQLLGLPRSSVHELVQTLVALRCLNVAPSSGPQKRFQLGLLLHELGAAYLAGMELAREGQSGAREIAAACGETVHLAVLDGSDVVYIAKVDSIHPVRMVSEVGRRLPAHCTGVGKALLYEFTLERLIQLLGDGPLPQMTANSVGSVAHLYTQLLEAHADGFVLDRCESNLDVCCVAAPVRDSRAEIVAALSISVPTVRVSDSWPGALGALVRTGADGLSRRLGYIPPPIGLTGTLS